ncbi:MAG: ATP-binding protein [Candidatus Baltobacteraceae bacterium]
MRWVLDTTDLRAVAGTRRAIADEIAPFVPESNEQFAIEVITGEILSAEVANGGRCITIELQTGLNSVIIEVWDQGPPLVLGADPLRDALLHSLSSYLDIEHVGNGNHIVVRLPINLKEDPARSARIWRLASALVSDRAHQMSESFRDTFVQHGAGDLFAKDGQAEPEAVT